MGGRVSEFGLILIGFYARVRRKKRVKNEKGVVPIAALRELWSWPWLRFSCRRHRACALLRRIAKTCSEGTGFANPCSHSINHRRNRVVRNASNQENHQCRLARRIRT